MTFDFNRKMLVRKTSYGTWQVAGQDYYCEFLSFAEAVTEAHRVFDPSWSGNAESYEWWRFFPHLYGPHLEQLGARPNKTV